MLPLLEAIFQSGWVNKLFGQGIYICPKLSTSRVRAAKFAAD